MHVCVCVSMYVHVCALLLVCWCVVLCVVVNVCVRLGFVRVLADLAQTVCTRYQAHEHIPFPSLLSIFLFYTHTHTRTQTQSKHTHTQSQHANIDHLRMRRKIRQFRAANGARFYPQQTCRSCDTRIFIAICFVCMLFLLCLLSCMFMCRAPQFYQYLLDMLLSILRICVNFTVKKRYEGQKQAMFTGPA